MADESFAPTFCPRCPNRLTPAEAKLCIGALELMNEAAAGYRGVNELLPKLRRLAAARPDNITQ